jgi:aldehyde dehydrogenase (NAD+)
LEGNTVVFKPSELTPMVGQITAELFANAKFPPGVFNLLHGDGRVGHKLVSDSRVNHVAFTGSVDVGQSIKSICAHTWGKTCTCEMGSKSAVIVFDDADLDLAVSGALNSAFKLSGQRCVSSGRILVQRSILESFKEKFLSEVKKIHVSDPFAHPNESVNYSVNYGPLINKDQLERVKFFNDHVRSDSDATVLFDGDRFVWSDSQIEFVYLSPGYWLRPFVYQVEWSDKIYLKREVFGPHVAIIPFDDLDDAIRIYNDTEYGLALGVCTSDFKKMKKVKSECDAGMIYFNLGSIGAESHFPFTGVKKSGFGGSSAAGMFENVVHKVAVTVNHAETINFPQGMK